jgi:Ca2+-binding RTX toxin-like protein
MAVRNWGTLSNNDTLAGGDTIYFNNVAWHAAKVVLVDITGAMTVTLAAKTVTMPGLSIAAVTNSTFGFADGSVVIMGTSAGNSLAPAAGVHDDLLFGQGGADTLDGGDGNDSLNGGVNTDSLTGGAGNDSLDGGAGSDTMVGGDGNDVYTVNLLSDVIFEDSLHGGAGNDTVLAQVNNYVLGDDLENLTLLAVAGVVKGTGNASGNKIVGNLYKNELLGLDGNDSLVGAAGGDTLDGGAGSDTMNGGAQNDLYYIDTAGDSIEADASGLDTVKITLAAGFDYTLPDTLEKLDARDVTTAGRTYTGNGGDDTMLGGVKSETMLGGDGVDSLVGGGGSDSLDGGAGDDTLNGGTGNDTFGLDSSGDTIIDGAGVDTAKISGNGFTYTLGDVVEKLDASAAASGGSYTGNLLDNTLTGSAHDDTLDGGAGTDALIGGDGDDTFVIDTQTDSLSDSSGSDTVKITGNGFDYQVSGSFENIDASMVVGGAFTYRGTSGDNRITASASASDTLWGYGGNDSLVGGLTNFDELHGGTGDDHYYLTGQNPIMDEDSVNGGGTDTVHIVSFYISSYTLGADLENLDASASTAYNILTLTGNTGNNIITGAPGASNWMDGGDGNDSLIGTDNYSDHLTGGNGSDTLVGGGGGGGPDQMNGGDGDDTYYVDSDLEPSLISDSGGTDSLHIQGSLLHSLSLGSSPALENLYANESTQATTLTGSASGNVIVGSAYNDSITGGGGNDYLEGGAGADTVVGSSGSDVFRDDFSGAFVITGGGGGGNDTLQPENGASLYFNTGSVTGIHVIDLTADGNANFVELTSNLVDAAFDRAGGTTLYIYGNANDSVHFDGDAGGPWAYNPFGDGIWDTFDYNGMTVAVAKAIDITNTLDL